jgi:hypothetical protein
MAHSISTLGIDRVVLRVRADELDVDDTDPVCHGYDLQRGDELFM